MELRHRASQTLLLLLVCTGFAAGENCGNFACPTGFELVPSPAAVQCSVAGHPACATGVCCAEITCGADASALLAANHVTNVAVLTACDSVAEGACTSTCLAGFTSAAAPTIRCIAANSYQVTNPCTVITCPTPWPGSAAVNVVAPTSTELAACNTAVGGTCTLTCLPGFTGTATLQCSAAGTYTVGGAGCTEVLCGGFPLATGMEASALASACTIMTGTVQPGVLKPVTANQCTLACQAGYAAGGSAVLSCGTTQLTPVTTLTCTEKVCDPYTLLVGMEPATAGTPCTVASNAVSALKPVTANTCDLQCNAGYDAAGAVALACSAAALTPVTALTCTPKTCTGSVTPPTHMSVGVFAARSTGEVVSVAGAGPGPGPILTIDAGYYCTGTPTALCSVSGANAYTVSNAVCQAIVCATAFTEFSSSFVNSVVTTGCDEVLNAACALTCADGYKHGAGGAPTLQCTGSATAMGTVNGAWQLNNPCVPITCSLASVQAAAVANNIVSPTTITANTCDTVPGAACVLTCAPGYVAGTSGAPLAKCTAQDTVQISNHCTVVCSEPARLQVTGGALVATGLVAPTTTTCAAGTGFLLRAAADTIRCNAPPVGVKADPARDCTVDICCFITCGFAPCSGAQGFTLKAQSNTISCSGSTTATCGDDMCCDRKPCSATNAPMVPGSTVSCTSATLHGQACDVTPQQGYVCTGSVTCTPASSDTASYSSTSACGLAPCPDNANTQPICACNTGYDGTPTWGGTGWIHQCTPKPCACTQVANSAYSASNSLCGVVGTTTAIVCDAGYTATAPSATCIATTLTFSVVQCTAQVCPATAVANSVLYSATGSITGSTGTKVFVECKQGYVGQGTDCPGNCAATCDGTAFNVVQCLEQACPDNSAPPGTCTCNTGYTGTPVWSTAERRWTHTCQATCALYTCPSPYSLRQLPGNHVCGSLVADCTTGVCCKGAILTPTALTVSEDGTEATFSVSLISRPTNVVTLPLTSSNTLEAKVLVSSLTFTSDNYATPQAVTVKGVADDSDDGDQTVSITTAALISQDVDYNGLNLQDVTVTVLDVDLRGVSVHPRVLTTTEAGDTASFTVVLVTKPTASVTVPVSVDNAAEGRVSVTSLTFTTQNWNANQTVEVTGLDDKKVDGNVVYKVLLGPATSSDTTYNSVVVPFVSVTNTDNDVRGITVTPTSGLVTSEAGASALFTIVLKSEPYNSVTVPLSSSDVTEGVLALASVSFTPTTWLFPQTISVRGVQDKVADGDTQYRVVTGPAVSNDAAYAGFDADDVGVVNTDDDTVGFTVTPTEGLVTSEAGTRAQFTVALASEPLSDVTVAASVAGDEVVVSPTMLVFSPANYSSVQVFEVVGQDDDVDDGDKAFGITLAATSGDAAYDSTTPSAVAGVNRDNDVAGVLVSPATPVLEVSEAGASSTFTVVLKSLPLSPVTVAFSWDTTEASLEPASFVFNSRNWNVPVTVRVTGVDDKIDDGDVLFSITGTSTSQDASYANIDVSSVSVKCLDDDTKGLTVTPETGLRTTEFGTSDTFTIVLNTEPVDQVTVTISSSNPGEGTVAPSTVLFSPANWQIARTVQVTGVQDTLQDGDTEYAMRFRVSSTGDARYNGMSVSDVPVTNQDDDTPGIITTPLRGLVTSEAGGTATFTVRLRSQPTSTVTLPLTTDTTEARLSVPALVFTTTNWNVEQTVTVTGVNDDAVDGDVAYIIATQQATSADRNYHGLSGLDVSATNTDDDTAGLIATPVVTPLVTTEDGGTAAVTVVLKSQPTVDVTVQFTGDTTEVAFDPTFLVFTTASWQTPLTVTLEGIDDNVADGDQNHTVSFNTLLTLDDNYRLLPPVELHCLNRDNDAAAVVVAKASDPLVTTEAGGTATFSVVLATRPYHNVNFAFRSSNTLEGVVAPSTLEFVPEAWKVPQTVTVTGVDDDVDDGDVAYEVSIDVASADLAYHAQTVAAVALSNTDGDTAGVTIDPLAGLRTMEAGGTSTFAVRLDTKPSAKVSIRLVSGDPSEASVSPSEVVFTSLNWNVAQTATVTGVDDKVADGNVTFLIETKAAVSADPRYDGYNAPSVTVVNEDDDTAGILVTNTAGLVTTEGGGTAHFTIVLQSQPTSGVSITATSSDTSEGTVANRLIIFSPSNWDTPQNVTIVGVDDPLDDGNVDYRITLSDVSSSDPSYDNRAVDSYAITNIDNDTPGVTVAPTTGLSVTEAGGRATFTVYLNSQPTADVTIALESSNTLEGTIDTSTLLFTPANWATERTVTVQGKDDSVDDDDVAFTVTLANAVSSDAAYENMVVSNVACVNEDDDTAAIVLEPTEGLVTSESGTSATFTVKLATEPLSGVRVDLSSDDITECSVLPGMLLFTAGNWSTAAVVTVQGTDDDQDDGDVAVKIVTSAAISTDPKYDGMNAADVAVLNNDNDTAGVTVTPRSGLVTSEDGQTASFTVQLKSKPTHTVEIDLVSSMPTEGTPTPSKLTFLPSFWNVAQTVIVTGLDDDGYDKDIPYTVSAERIVSDDALYGALGPSAVVVHLTNTDNDAAGITVTPTEGLRTTEAGGSATFVLALMSKPTADVRVGVESSNPAECVLNFNSVLFTPAEWDTPKTVTVTGVDDDVRDGDVRLVVRTHAAASTDEWYNGFDAADVLVTNADNDEAGLEVLPASVRTEEEGSPVVASVRLRSQPLAGVFVAVASTDTTEAVASPDTLLFTASNWNVTQSVNITGVYDNFADGDRTYGITFTVQTVDAVYALERAVRIEGVNRDMLNECYTTGRVCAAAGQICDDAESAPSSLDDFTCTCAGAAGGSARGSVAVCTYTDDCLANGATCSAASQQCIDPDVTVSNNWRCACVAPHTTVHESNTTVRLSTCVLDECVEAGKVCEAVGQVCVDRNTDILSLGNWECRCKAPLEGSAVVRIATCAPAGECALHGNTCGTDSGQHCVDPDQGVSGDWMCVCDKPFVGGRIGAKAECRLDECVEYGRVCNEAGQVCKDPNETQLRDWTCQCIGLREVGKATAMQAACTVDECFENTICTAAGQVCEDSNTSVDSLADWQCRCVAPAVGSAPRSAASCAFSGECLAFSSVCTDAGQTCFDPSTALGDWQCRCVVPYEDTYAVAKPALCVFDECTVHGGTCAAKGQHCVDRNTDPTAQGDWRCECVAPSVGSAIGEPAQCAYVGECVTAHAICEAAGQRCVDESSAANDWTCVCTEPQTGSAAGAPAACLLDECIENAKTCASRGQLCDDPNKDLRSLFDWTCQCVAPATGSARARAATCVYAGECAEHSAVCTSAGQTCEDPNDDEGNWQCVCLAPSAGRAVAKAATCFYDECSNFGSTCSAVGQSCEDPNTHPASLKDWKCKCSGSRAKGEATAAVATCLIDECIENARFCTAVGQRCTDPNQAPSSLDNWVCECVPAELGTKQGGPATCQHTGACVEGASVCAANGQSCEAAGIGSFGCRCLAPTTGFTERGPAACTLDECDVHKKTCRDQGQRCKDINTATTNLDDWVCQCIESGAGSAKLQAATCTHTGECEHRARVCVAAGQGCHDPSPTAGNWECVCVPPYTGKATAGVAECVFDECTLHRSTCTDVGQACHDPNTDPDKQGDWTCTCTGSTATGTAIAKPAQCVYDECQVNAATCAAVGQACVDPDTSPSSVGNWRCVCVAPSTGFQERAAAVCTHVGECVRFASVCTSQGQSCNDLSTSETGNWQCECLEPYSGTAKGHPAVCTVDECILHSRECSNRGQTCRDPSAKLGDWTCDCVAPATGKGQQAAATCEYQGECSSANVAAVCLAAGQACIDPDVSRVGDWQCACPSPRVGVRTGGAAACELDECIVHAEVCAVKGQECSDPNTSPFSTNDWMCRCVQSATGFAKAAPALCFHQGECADHHTTCTAVGQACYDPNLARTGDWECVCVSPQTGKAAGRAAFCAQDECRQFDSICSAASQRCVDPTPTPSSTGDWRCECVGSAVGSALAAPARCVSTGVCSTNGHVCGDVGQACVASTVRKDEWHCECVPPFTGRRFKGAANCLLDECLVHEATCRALGQLCNDPNTDPNSVGDWKCMCVPPGIGSAVAAPAACIQTGECQAHAAVCSSAGQVCRDPDANRVNDWQCVCLTPEFGVATGKPATCALDECIPHGDTCQSAGQLCVDPTPLASSTGDWLCVCVGSSATGQGLNKPAVCKLDECRTAGLTCQAAGQTCIDPNIDPESTGDWKCTCPSTGQTLKGGVAPCSYLGSCLAQAGTCTDAGQACFDSSNSTAWECRCASPFKGSADAAIATCTNDECLTHGHICTAAGQTCRDPTMEHTKKDDWLCVCPAPLAGEGIGRPAACAYAGECTAHAVVCTAVGQECHDPTPALGDWLCACVAPQSGKRGAQAPAVCELDECAVHEATCHNVGQVCVDVDTRLTSTQDWRCACVPPASGSALAAAATCVHAGECVANEATCTAAGQTCVDPTQGSGDWQCRCTPPFSGSRVAGAAACVLDECVQHGHVCKAAGQLCVDSDTSLTAKGDWRCQCISPASGAAVGEAATCVYLGECVANHGVCEAAGQTCMDTDLDAADTWECRCVAPQTGSGKGAVATCILDECVEHGAVCTDAGQLCNDGRPSSASLNDWACSCASPAKGAAVAKPARCEVDECLSHGSACIFAGQFCNDPDRAVTGDWRCECVAPHSGMAVASVATCTFDECLVNTGTCAERGQKCEDQDTATTSLGDWTCKCTGSAEGSAVGAPAVCAFQHECVTHGHTCEAAGQACSDPNPAIGDDWECLCIEPLGGSASRGIAFCTYDECAVHGHVCTAAGQTCVDENTARASTDDWRCACSGGVGSAVASVAVCVHDECVLNSAVCIRAGQACNDPNPSPTRLGDWMCTCVGSASGAAQAGAAACVYENECNVHAAICTMAGQSCLDPNDRVSGDWQCVCVEPSAGVPATRKPAKCLYDECASGSGKACMAAGQACIDVVPLSTSLDDWICECAGSGNGLRTRGVAPCQYDGECDEKGALCAGRGRACLDTDVSTPNNWRCICAPPSVEATVDGVSSCVINECLRHGSVCAQQGQECHDPNTSEHSTGDWMCRCTGEGQAGSATSQPAVCTVNECLTNTVCAAQGQMCIDRNTTASTGDWECQCLGSGVGSAVARAATCTYEGSCQTNFGVCAAQGQACRNVADGYECLCTAPHVGRAKNKVAACTFDECTKHWATCAAAGQTCNDPNGGVESLGDWQCICTGSSTGHGVAQAATCSNYGECEAHAATCAAKNQACYDKSPLANDWSCECAAPYVRSHAVGAACKLDECLVFGKFCAEQGQTCHDPSVNEGDWLCVCVSPAVGSATAGKATCTEFGECVANAATCTSKGQACVDATGLNVLGDWACQCIAPLTGRVNGQAASCVLDECAVHGSVCAAAGQTCNDPDTSPLKTGDWTCSCVGVVAHATASPALCLVDECVAKNRSFICSTNGQRCHDPNPYLGALDDWMCLCVGGTGSSVAKPATCQYAGECGTQETTCTSVGQTCIDPNTNVADDWMCECILPAVKVSSDGKKAVCRLDECREHASTCMDAGQTCVDPDMSPTALNNWKCVCGGSSTGEAVAAAAQCSHNFECATHQATCVSEGQTCVDNTTAVLNDWHCACVAPAVGTPVRAAVASCQLDECVVHKHVCAAVGQTCTDPNTLAGSTGDWLCVCTGSGRGTARGQAATCTYPHSGKCAANHKTCDAAGQMCNENGNSWSCHCAAPLVGSATEAAALCTNPGECAANNVCSDAGQDCHDPDFLKTNDWECRCRAPLKGSATAAAAACRQVNTGKLALSLTGGVKAAKDAEDALLTVLAQAYGLAAAEAFGPAMFFFTILPPGSLDSEALLARFVTVINGRTDAAAPQVARANLRLAYFFFYGAAAARSAQPLALPARPPAATGEVEVSFVGADRATLAAWLAAADAAKSSLASAADVRLLESPVQLRNATPPVEGVRVESVAYTAEGNSTRVEVLLSEDGLTSRPLNAHLASLATPAAVANQLSASPLFTASAASASSNDCAGACATGQACVDADAGANGVYVCKCGGSSTGSDGVNGEATCTPTTPAPPTLAPPVAFGAADSDDEVLGMARWVSIVLLIVLIVLCLVCVGFIAMKVLKKDDGADDMSVQDDKETFSGGEEASPEVFEHPQERQRPMPQSSLGAPSVPLREGEDVTVVPPASMLAEKPSHLQAHDGMYEAGSAQGSLHPALLMTPESIARGRGAPMVDPDAIPSGPFVPHATGAAAPLNLNQNLNPLQQQEGFFPEVSPYEHPSHATPQRNLPPPLANLNVNTHGGISPVKKQPRDTTGWV